MGDRHKTPTISLRLSPDLLGFVEQAAAAEGKSRHAWLVELVEAARHGLGDELDQDQAAAFARGFRSGAETVEGAHREAFGWFGPGD